MPVRVDPTPNPNAMKFTVGVPVGGPVTFTAAAGTDDRLGTALLALEGVISVFSTADFVTLTKSDDGDWTAITPAAVEILETHFG